MHHWPSELVTLCFNLSISTKGQQQGPQEGRKAELKPGLSSGVRVTQSCQDSPGYRELDRKKR